MAIKCTSIKEGAIWPHQVVALLGVEEGVFPKAEEPTALFDSELESGQRPRKNDRDRTLMLQLLLAPEKKLFLSYSLQEEGGSHLLRELRAFLQEAYGLSLEVEEHPLLPFDPIYFKEGSELATHSNSHYRAALIHAEQQKREFLLPSFYVKRTSQPIEVCASDASLQQLEKFARNPLKYYLNESLQFYPDSLDVDLERGEFSLSPLKRYQLAQKALKGSLDEVIQEARLQGIFPAGTLGALAEDHLIFDVAQRESQLEKLGVEKGDLFEVVLHPFYRQWTQLKPTLFGAPPVKLGGGLEITGTLGPLCSKGLLCFGEDNLEGWVRSWPAYLVFQHLPHLQGELLSMKKGKAMTSSPHDPTEALESYLRYFAKSSVDPSPLMPEWLSFFLSRDVVGLEKKLEQLEVVTTGVFVDPSWQWLVRRDGLPRASALIANWSDLIVQTFGGYFDL
jgi:exonuclease V gamma subunit